MNAVFPWSRWLQAALWVCAAAVAVAYGFDQKHDIWHAVETGVSTGSTLCTVFVLTPLWRALWLFPLIRKRLPLLDGEWRGVQTSNWPIIQALKDGAKSPRRGIDVDDAATDFPALLNTEVEVTIASTFFTIRMDLQTAGTGYQNSTLKAAVLTPETDKARGRLTYVFEGRVPIPRSTDVDRFDGAADLDIRQDTGGLTLGGCVWTNRNWSKGLNTAGRIVLRREIDGSVPKWVASIMNWFARRRPAAGPGAST